MSFMTLGKLIQHCRKIILHQLYYILYFIYMPDVDVQNYINIKSFFHSTNICDVNIYL